MCTSEVADTNSPTRRLATILSQRRRRVLGALLGLPLITSRGARAQSTDAAVARIRSFYDALLDVMKQAQRLGVRGRYDKLAPAIRRAFDLAAMTRIAVGPAWTGMAPADHTALVDAFGRMTIATYANRFDGYSGERFEVQPASETRTTGRLVRTRLVQSSGEPIALDYLMRGAGDDWKIVDVYLTGTISELATRRAEFSSILKSGGAPALVKSLDAQAEQLLA